MAERSPDKRQISLGAYRLTTKPPTHRSSRTTALAKVAFATLGFTTAPAATREPWQQRIEADWLLAADVAQVPEPAVSQISKSACVGNIRGARKFQRPAGLETGDTTDSEVCATVAFATDWLLAEEVAAQDQLGGLVTTKADVAGGCDGIMTHG